MSLVTSVDELRGMIGEELGSGPWHEVTRAEILAYSAEVGGGQSADVAPPFLLLGMTNLLQRNREGVRVEIPARSSVNYGLNNIEFCSAVCAGSHIRARTRLVNVEDIRADVVQITYGITIESDAQSAPVLRAEMLARLYL